MVTNTRPYLFLDVDGVLALSHAPSEAFEHHYVTDSSGENHEIYLDKRHGLIIRQLAIDYDIVWATGWEQDAPRLLQPLLDLPAFPHIRFSQQPERGVFLNKLRDLVKFAGTRDFAWLDDSISSEDRRLASFLPNDTMLLAPDPAIGLTEHHSSELESFVQRVNAVRSTEASTADGQQAQNTRTPEQHQALRSRPSSSKSSTPSCTTGQLVCHQRALPSSLLCAATTGSAETEPSSR